MQIEAPTATVECDAFVSMVANACLALFQGLRGKSRSLHSLSWS